jgi:hypothetical protein
MKVENQGVEQGFYEECARLLRVPYTYTPWPSPTRGPNRWNNRHPGNGRYEGYGTIKMYGPNVIHVALRTPHVINCVCKSTDEVFTLLRGIV